VQLTYWGLQNYDRVPAAKAARKSLVKQARAMMLDKWRHKGQICENFYPAKSSPNDDCSPGAMHFYHWGALSGFVSLVEEGYY